MPASSGGILAASLLILLTFQTFAHDPGLSTATLQWEPDRLEINLVFSQADARQVLNLAASERGKSSREEMARAPGASEPFHGLVVKFDDQPAQSFQARWRFDESDNASLSLTFKHGSCSTLYVRSTLLGQLPPGHRQLLSLKDSRGHVLVEQWLTAQSDSATIQTGVARSQPEPEPDRHSFTGFLALGIRHIWTGYDHLLFLFGLLIATRNFVSSLKVITCFTLAHSITLAVATFSQVEFPTRIVEPLIAASIVYVGLENLLRRGTPAGRGLLTFGFGLIHGFGFASVLREMGIGAQPGGVALPLLTFNLGVELGQIAVAAVVLPFLWKLKANPAFALRWMPACSVAVTLLGGYWLVERLW